MPTAAVRGGGKLPQPSRSVPRSGEAASAQGARTKVQPHTFPMEQGTQAHAHMEVLRRPVARKQEGPFIWGPATRFIEEGPGTKNQDGGRGTGLSMESRGRAEQQSQWAEGQGAEQGQQRQ